MSEDESTRLLADLEELRRQADALGTRLSASLDPRLSYSGADRNGLAQVIVDGHGRATDVVVSRKWRQETDPAGLARAIVHATNEAQTRRLEAWAAGGGRPADASLLATPALDGLLDTSGADLIRDLLPLLERAERQLDDAAHLLEKHFTEKATLASPGGELTITAQSGQVTEIEFDRRWIASAGAEEVAQRVCHLLQLAHDRTWIGIGGLLPRELGGLMSFAADPERMLRQLGFRT
jgi:DNA-binding protein YbaB